jgi:hypothetical protein
MSGSESLSGRRYSLGPLLERSQQKVALPQKHVSWVEKYLAKYCLVVKPEVPSPLIKKSQRGTKF